MVTKQNTLVVRERKQKHPVVRDRKQKHPWGYIKTMIKIPLIGITTDSSLEDYSVRKKYCNQVLAAGAYPILLPPVSDIEKTKAFLENLDGIIFTGGGDHNPLLMNEEPVPELGNINPERDNFEIPLCQEAYKRNLPILGICRGIQTIAIALGGHVKQHISTSVKHSQNAPKDSVTHSVKIEKGSILSEIYNSENIFVNSFHHQAVDNPGSRFKAVAFSKDNIIEAIESTEYHSVIGVQWHPEQLHEEGLKLFQWLSEEARIYREAREIHNEIISLDSHCDTPMFFSQNVDFINGDSRILYDLQKMNCGRIDAVTMVCYLPQPKQGQKFSDVSQFGIESEKEYTDIIFNKVEEICRHEGIAKAVSFQEVAENKKKGIRSIMLGIENGIALEHNLKNIQHFHDKGIKYITLCHNGDNDICDSARGTETHHGVSEFGKEVIREMNRLGIAVDLSHAAESSFYDAIKLSEKPIVCSHSNCRALCNHPRNLTDEQMRTLAAHDGVMQLTLYGGFLKENGEADINDFLKHLFHAIEIMGIDHVGIGTDFDGDGGVKGLSSAAELMNITTQLLRHGFSKEEIEKIWGKNWINCLTGK